MYLSPPSCQHQQQLMRDCAGGGGTATYASSYVDHGHASRHTRQVSSTQHNVYASYYGGFQSQSPTNLGGGAPSCTETGLPSDNRPSIAPSDSSRWKSAGHEYGCLLPASAGSLQVFYGNGGQLTMPEWTEGVSTTGSHFTADDVTGARRTMASAVAGVGTGAFLSPRPDVIPPNRHALHSLGTAHQQQGYRPQPHLQHHQLHNHHSHHLQPPSGSLSSLDANSVLTAIGESPSQMPDGPAGCSPDERGGAGIRSSEGGAGGGARTVNHNQVPFDWMKKQIYPLTPSSGKTRTKDKYRIVYSEHQKVELEKEFLYNPYITIQRKAELASIIGLSDRQVKIWFQNRRAKERKQKKKRPHTAAPGTVDPAAHAKVTNQVNAIGSGDRAVGGVPGVGGGAMRQSSGGTSPSSVPGYQQGTYHGRGGAVRTGSGSGMMKLEGGAIVEGGFRGTSCDNSEGHGEVTSDTTII